MPDPRPFSSLSRHERVALARDILAHPNPGKPMLTQVSRVPEGAQAVEVGGSGRPSSGVDLRDILAHHAEAVIYLKPPSGFMEWMDGIVAPLVGKGQEPIYAVRRTDLVWLEKEIHERLEIQHTASSPDKHTSVLTKDEDPNANAMRLFGHTRVAITAGLLAGLGREHVGKVIDHEVAHLARNHYEKLYDPKVKWADEAAWLRTSHHVEFEADSVGALGDPVAMAKMLVALRAVGFDAVARKDEGLMGLLARQAPDVLERMAYQKIVGDHPLTAARVARLLDVSLEEIERRDVPKLSVTPPSALTIADATYVDRPPVPRLQTGTVKRTTTPRH